MYAVFQTGGKQYKVNEGQILKVEKLKANMNESIEFNNILLIKKDNNLIFGTPFIKESKIIATVIKEYKDKKINIIKFNRRKHFRKHQGHRQVYTNIRIDNIFA